MIEAVLVECGLFISLYASFVYVRHELNPAYRPLCEISELFSCLRPFEISESRLFFIPNAFLGILAYSFLAFLLVFDLRFVAFSLVFLMSLISIYLAYISYAFLKNICLLCTSIYIINFSLFILLLSRFLF